MTEKAEISADQWLAFLANAIGGLSQAAADLRNCRGEFERKTDWFRKGKAGAGIPRETSVSQALKQLFQRIRAKQAISGCGTQDIDLRHISIECEVPRPRDPGIGDESKPTDFSLVLLMDNELDLRIEAKTLVSDADLRMEYLGERGLRRFEDQTNPYTLHPFGGMIAYVVDSDATTWSAKIGEAVVAAVGQDKSSLRLIGNIERRVSRHRVASVADCEKEQHIEIDVFHLALEIDAVPARR